MLNYHKSSIKPPNARAYFFQSGFMEGLIEKMGEGVNLTCGETGYHTAFQTKRQCAKKVVSDSPGQVDFAIGLVNSVLNWASDVF